jgi:hypothetical protein
VHLGREDARRRASSVSGTAVAQPIGLPGDCKLRARSRAKLRPQVEQELRDVGPFVELGLDPSEHTAPVPERTFLSGATLCVTHGDDLERAERLVLDLGFHTWNMPARTARSIGSDADSGAGSY